MYDALMEKIETFLDQSTALAWQLFEKDLETADAIIRLFENPRR